MPQNAATPAFTVLPFTPAYTARNTRPASRQQRFQTPKRRYPRLHGSPFLASIAARNTRPASRQQRFHAPKHRYPRLHGSPFLASITARSTGPASRQQHSRTPKILYPFHQTLQAVLPYHANTITKTRTTTTRTSDSTLAAYISLIAARMSSGAMGRTASPMKGFS